MDPSYEELLIMYRDNGLASRGALGERLRFYKRRCKELQSKLKERESRLYPSSQSAHKWMLEAQALRHENALQRLKLCVIAGDTDGIMAAKAKIAECKKQARADKKMVDGLIKYIDKLTKK